MNESIHDSNSFFDAWLFASYDMSQVGTFALPTCAVLIPAPDDLHYCSMLLTGVAASWKTIPGVLA
ncbi:MAG: hypothetical protein CK551_09875 [Planctomycetaceae bacterium]|nr:MAG: hypothetical protein CK551_09875 [Planctomycetaceae bacterium]